MKKIIIPIIAAAAFTAALVSCQKQDIVVSETSHEVTLTFASEKPSFDDETKTEWTGETIQWSEGDKISVAYTVNGNWQNASGDASGDAKLYKSEALDAAAATAKFNVSASFKGATEGTHTHVFYGVYPAPSGTDFGEAPVASLNIPSIQTPLADSFDGSADLMTGVSVGDFTSRPEDGETISMAWTRLVAHANITLKALNGVTDGETVSSIILTAQDDANLVGQQKVNILTNAVEKDNETTNVVELNGGNLTIDAEGNIEFWACVLPETLTSLTVVVETNKATYTREITGISKTFKQNARNSLSIKMDEATRVTKEEVFWVQVDPADELTEGTYVLIASTGTKTGALVSTNGSSSAPTYNTSVSVSGDVLNGVTEAMQFDLSKTGDYYKLAATGQTTNYLYTIKDNNGVRIGTNTNNVWTIAHHESNPNAFVFMCNATSRYLGVYNNADWRSYTAYNASNFINDTGSSQIYLYKKIIGPYVPTPRISVSQTSIEVDADATSAEFTYTLKNAEGAPEVSIADGGTMTNVSATAAGGIVTVIFDENEDTVEKSATLVLSIEGAEDVEVVITQKAWVDTSVIEELTIAEFLEKSAYDAVWYKLTGIVSGIYNTTYGNFYLNDGETSVQVYGLTATKVDSNDKSFSSLNIKDGDELTLIGTRADYNGTAQVGGPAYYVSHVPAPYLEVSSTTLNVAADATTVEFTVDANVDWSVSCTADATATKTDNNVVVTFAANETEDAKVYEVTITSELGDETVTITQAAVSSGEVGEEVTVTKTIADIADFNSWVNSTKYAIFPLDGIVTATATGGSNTGKYYTSGEDWRLYQTESPTLKISAIDGYMIKSVKITYSVSNTGVLTYSGSNIVSGTVVNVNESSITFGVGNTGTATNGQVRVTAIEVVYQAN